MTYRIETAPDEARSDQVVSGLVAFNQRESELIRRRFEEPHLRPVPLVAYALTAGGELLGGGAARAVPLWQWVEIDELWVQDAARGQGIGAALLASLEAQARALGCRWSKLNTWDFQAPGFYKRQGYVTYATEEDYPPGHVNHLMRKTLG
ncbi:GNAT family N-acetyltransferase [Deinococcus radiotolerans]|uniref:N-acetyltransferase n=1 Tax=Deinococcus radiotolerans TaxID=1309407 RepID=A0ABQ2FLG1_9DEIO|nr:GNAT family N-acetyltransferase [Deinococcus radiotolerans]GGL09509.1 N-acetyltransferase [Deinococcus radiotolerans]